MTPVLTIPGLGGSGPEHWQRYWETSFLQCRSVTDINWNIPDKSCWLEGLHNAILACEEPPLLAAHSLGCSLVAHWAALHPDVPIKGALLVAPSDLDNCKIIPAEALCFAPMPMTRLPFPISVVASNNDAFVEVKRARIFAAAWGGDFTNLGNLGHINADSHLAKWDEGWTLLHSINTNNFAHTATT